MSHVVMSQETDDAWGSVFYAQTKVGQNCPHFVASRSSMSATWLAFGGLSHFFGRAAAEPLCAAVDSLPC
jgi:hypothetical protein